MCTEDIRTGSEPGDKERCSAESSERSSLATTPEPRRDRLGSLPTPRPRFPPPSIPTIGDLVPAGQTHDGRGGRGAPPAPASTRSPSYPPRGRGRADGADGADGGW